MSNLRGLHRAGSMIAATFAPPAEGCSTFATVPVWVTNRAGNMPSRTIPATHTASTRRLGRFTSSGAGYVTGFDQ